MHRKSANNDNSKQTIVTSNNVMWQRFPEVISLLNTCMPWCPRALYTEEHMLTRMMGDLRKPRGTGKRMIKGMQEEEEEEEEEEEYVLMYDGN